MHFRVLICLLLLSGCRKIQDEPCFRTGTCAEGAGCIYNHQCGSGVCGGGTCQSPTCGDGVRNGGESAVDCGGHCGATCGVGSACASLADCAFGSCSAGQCAAPSTGPAPTGPVATTLAPAGGAVTVVSSEHVSVTFTFPAGAVKQPVSLRLVPLPLQGSAWLRVSIEPAGLLLQQPAAVVITLPPGTSARDGVVRVGGSSPYLLPATVTGSTLAVSTNWFRFPSALHHLVLQQPRRASTAVTQNPGDQLEALALPFDSELALAESLLAAAVQSDAIDDVLALQSVILKILLFRNQPEDAARIDALILKMYGSACAGLHRSQARLDALPVQSCSPEGSPAQKQLLSWERALQVLGTPQGETCAGNEDSGYLATLRKSFVGTGVDSIRTNPVAFAECVCRTAQLNGFQDQELAAACTARLSPGGKSDEVLRPAAVVAAADVKGFARLEQLPDAAQALGDGEEQPLLLDARTSAFAHGKTDGNSQPVGELLQRVPGEPAAQEDAEYAAGTVNFAAIAAGNATVSGTLAVDAAGGETPATTTAPLAVRSDGKVQLTGPLPSLECPPAVDGTTPASRENDSLSVRVAGTEVARQPADVTGDLLTPTITLQVADLYSAARQDPAVTPDLDLELWRDSPGCGGVYLTGPFKLYTLQLKATAPISLAVAGRNLGYPADPLTSPVNVVPFDRAFVQATLQHGDLPLSGQALAVQKYSNGAFAPYASMITDAAGHASFTGDRPAAADTYSITYAETGADCSAVPRPAGCHVAIATVLASSGVAVSGPSGVPKGGTAQFTAKVLAGSDQSVNWAVSGLGSIDGNGLFSAGARAGFLTVTATSPTHTWVGTAPAHVQFTNIDFLGSWTGPQTYNRATAVTTDAGLVAGSTLATCTATSATLTVRDCGIPDGGCGALDPVDQLSLQYDPCNNFNHTGQAKDLGVQSDPITGRADDLFFSVVGIDGGTITIQGDFTISGARNEYFLQRAFTMSKAW